MAIHIKYDFVKTDELLKLQFNIKNTTSMGYLSLQIFPRIDGISTVDFQGFFNNQGLKLL